MTLAVMRLESFRRSRRWILFGISFLVVFLFLAHRSTRQVLVPVPVVEEPVAPLEVNTCDPDPPSNWDKLYKWEDEMPQHNLDLPFPEGRTGKYVFFRNQIQGLGWNNLLNEILMNSYLAYKSNRTYVYWEYYWNRNYYPWKHLEKPESPRTPMNALISGPSAGGAWDPHDPAPRSVSHRFFDIVCPPEERRIINTREIKPAIYWEPNGRVIFETWRKLLSEAPERCIEIQPAEFTEDKVPQVFDLWFWGSGKCNDLWDEYRDCPVSRLLKTSHVVESAVARNLPLLTSKGPKPPLGASSEPFDRTIAVHIRRGDYDGFCIGLAQWNSTFYGWNLLPFLPDKFPYPPGWDVDRNETIKTYLRHCFPTQELITNKIRASKKDYIDAAKPGEVRFLDTVYILTNDKTEWVEDLMKMLVDDGWKHVVTTKLLELDSQQKDVGQAVDMDFARRAAVFIGNGWSSFTSNVNHRRFVDRKEPISSRFF